MPGETSTRDPRKPDDLFRRTVSRLVPDSMDELDTALQEAFTKYLATAAARPDEGLQAALKPFAEFADPRDTVPEGYVITQGSSMARRQLTMGDCYKARAALEGSAE